LRNDTLLRVRENYPAIAADLLNPLLELLIVARAVCGGDADKVLIVLLVSARASQHPAFKAATMAELQSAELTAMPGLGTNARSVAASLGMANETVRRKVLEMIAAGWFVRVGRDLHLTRRGHLQAEQARAAVENLAVRYFETVGSLRGAPPPMA
jgi:hypothetical protein